MIVTVVTVESPNTFVTHFRDSPVERDVWEYGRSVVGRSIHCYKGTVFVPLTPSLVTPLCGSSSTRTGDTSYRSEGLVPSPVCYNTSDDDRGGALTVSDLLSPTQTA